MLDEWKKYMSEDCFNDLISFVNNTINKIKLYDQFLLITGVSDNDMNQLIIDIMSIVDNKPVVFFNSEKKQFVENENISTLWHCGSGSNRYANINAKLMVTFSDLTENGIAGNLKSIVSGETQYYGNNDRGSLSNVIAKVNNINDLDGSVMRRAIVVKLQEPI